jgi:RNA polymerase sigma-54 factor
MAAAISAELSENPALDRLDEDEPISQEDILRCLAPSEVRPNSEDREFQRSLPRGDSDVVDWTDFASTENSLNDHLIAQIHSELPPALHEVGTYVVGCLDDHGYLTVPAEEIALECECSLDDAELVIEKLQDCEPAGIGAPNLRECLLLQLKAIDQPIAKVARRILRECFQEFLNHDWRPISRRCKVMPDVVQEAVKLIVSLNPYPAEAPVSGHMKGSLGGVVPDLVLNRTEQGWEIEVMGPSPSSLTINRAYRERLDKVASKNTADRNEVAHLRQFVDRARQFIEAIDQRKRTLIRIGEYLIQHQSGFVVTGEYQHLKSLTRGKVAQALGLHESTVSRSTTDKFVQIPTGEVVSFDVFFRPAMRVQKMIEEILSVEEPGEALSDERIAQILEQKGVQVARRTVNKYRNRHKLLSSRLRRSA